MRGLKKVQIIKDQCLLAKSDILKIVRDTEVDNAVLKYIHEVSGTKLQRLIKQEVN